MCMCTAATNASESLAYVRKARRSTHNCDWAQKLKQHHSVVCSLILAGARAYRKAQGLLAANFRMGKSDRPAVFMTRRHARAWRTHGEGCVRGATHTAITHWRKLATVKKWKTIVMQGRCGFTKRAKRRTIPSASFQPCRTQGAA